VAKRHAHPLFRKLSENDDALKKDDTCVQAMKTETEEGKQAERNNGSKYFVVYE
jgi:hypothetical protein